MDKDLCNRYVLCICENGGLTNAAKKLGISQPALSMAISGLEKKLGFVIFNRSSKPISLTEEGKIYTEYLREQELLQKDFGRKIEDLHKQYDTTLTIGGPMVYVNTLIAESIPEFYEKYPTCKIAIKDGNILDLIEDVKSGEVDFFISTSNDMPENFEVVTCKRERIYLCIPRTWEINSSLSEYQVQLGQKGKCMDFKRLEALKFISLPEQLPLQKDIRNFLVNYKVDMSSMICVNQVTSGVKLSALGMGIVIATQQALMAEVHLDNLCLYTLPDELFERELYVVYDKNRYLSHICMEFIKMLSDA